MNMITVDEERKHLRIWEMLPWIVNGTVAVELADDVQEHLRQCALCRTELARQRWVSTVMNMDDWRAPAVERGLEKLMHRLIEEDGEPRGRRVRGPWYRRSEAMAASSRRATMVAYGLAAVVLLEAGALAVVGRQLLGQQAQSGYRTLSSSAASTHHATIRFVADDTMPLGRLRELLASQNLQIVSGPGQNGVYSLAPVNSGGDVEAQVAGLRRASGVRFAEPIADAQGLQ